MTPEEFQTIEDALQACNIWDTPYMRRALGREFNEYELDAVRRVREALALCARMNSTKVPVVERPAIALDLTPAMCAQVRMAAETMRVTAQQALETAIRCFASELAGAVTGYPGPPQVKAETPDARPLACPWCIPGIDNCNHTQAEIARDRELSERRARSVENFRRRVGLPTAGADAANPANPPSGQVQSTPNAKT